MTDLDRVLRRVTDDPSFAAQLRTDPRAALDTYQLSDADFARLEQRMQVPTPASTTRVADFFTPSTRGHSWWQRTAGAVALGAVVVVGSGAGYALAASRSPSGPAAPTAGEPAMTPVAYSMCPAERAATTERGQFHRGDHVWVVGRDAASHWLRVRGPQGEPVWVSAATITTARIDDLPVATCALPSELAPAGATASDPVPNDSMPPDTSTDPRGTTPAPGQAGGDPSSPSGPNGVVNPPPPSQSVPADNGPAPSNPTGPTGSDDHNGPSIDHLTGDPTDIWQHYPAAGGRCVSQTAANITAQIGDPSGVSDAKLDWGVAGTPGEHGTVAMTRSASTWSAAIGPIEWIAGEIPAAGADVTVTIRADDGVGNPSTAGTTIHLHNAQECLG
jgi:hypothetical protein